MEDHEDDVVHCAVAKRAKVRMELQHLEEGSEDKSIVLQHDCARMVSSDFVECSTATSFDASLHHIYIYIYIYIYIHSDWFGKTFTYCY